MSNSGRRKHTKLKRKREEVEVAVVEDEPVGAVDRRDEDVEAKEHQEVRLLQKTTNSHLPKRIKATKYSTITKTVTNFPPVEEMTVH